MDDLRGRQFSEYIRNWENVRAVIQSHGRYTEEMLTYRMATFKFVDYSLVSDESVFRFKPPYILKYLWHSSYEKIQQFMVDLTDVQIRDKKQMTDFDVIHVVYLTQIVNYVMKLRFPTMDIRVRKKTLAADHRPARFFLKNYGKVAN